MRAARLALSGAVLAVGAAAGAQEYRGAAALLAAPDLRFQEQFGALAVAPDPDGLRGDVVLAVAGGKHSGKVGKAALIVPFPPQRPGETISVEAEVFLPPDAPRNSVHLMDLECKFCGVPGNPGLRLYLREGRLRIDRKKIGGGHAWANGSAPKVPVGRWVKLRWDLTLAAEADRGEALVWLDGVEVLRGRGRTLPAVPEDRAAVDRLQIGITANSNAGEAAVYVGALTLRLAR